MFFSARWLTTSSSTISIPTSAKATPPGLFREGYSATARLVKSIDPPERKMLSARRVFRGRPDIRYRLNWSGETKAKVFA
jgi:hypothetical protein